MVTKVYKVDVLLKDKTVLTYDNALEHSWLDDTGMIVVRTTDRIIIHNMIDVVRLQAWIEAPPIPVQDGCSPAECASCTPDKAEVVHGPWPTEPQECECEPAPRPTPPPIQPAHMATPAPEGPSLPPPPVPNGRGSRVPRR